MTKTIPADIMKAARKVARFNGGYAPRTIGYDELVDAIARAIMAHAAPLQRENERLRAAINWIEPPFVDETTSHEELRKRVHFCVTDARFARPAPREE